MGTIRRRHVAEADRPPVTNAEAAILLDGWGAYPPEGRRRTDATFELLHSHTEGVARLWQAHESYLRRLAAEWGWSPGWCFDDDPRPRYFGELAVETIAAGRYRCAMRASECEIQED